MFHRKREDQSVNKLIVIALAAFGGSTLHAHASSAWDLTPDRLSGSNVRGWSSSDLSLKGCEKDAEKGITQCKYSLFGVATVSAFANSQQDPITGVALRCDPSVCDAGTIITFGVYLLRSVSTLDDDALSALVASTFSAKVLSTPELTLAGYKNEQGTTFIIQKHE
jgi:hypothetical protein